jgi:hypothetical protein
MPRLSWKAGGEWFGHAANAYTFSSLIPAGVLGVIGGALSTGVTWISHFGLFGWFVSGLLTFVISAIGFAVAARTRLWRLDARLREKLKEGSSPFDPMARVYQNQRLFLSDLIPPGRTTMTGRKFINCEIIGPGDVIAAIKSATASAFPVFQHNIFHNINFIQIAPGVVPFDVKVFFDCDFQGCDFYFLNLLFYERGPDSPWHWITPALPEALPPPDPAVVSELGEGGLSGKKEP